LVHKTYNSRRIFRSVATNDDFHSEHLSDVTKMEVYYARKTGYFTRLVLLKADFSRGLTLT